MSSSSWFGPQSCVKRHTPHYCHLFATNWLIHRQLCCIFRAAWLVYSIKKPISRTCFVVFVSPYISPHSFRPQWGEHVEQWGCVERPDQKARESLEHEMGTWVSCHCGLHLSSLPGPLLLEQILAESNTMGPLNKERSVKNWQFPLENWWVSICFSICFWGAPGQIIYRWSRCPPFWSRQYLSRPGIFLLSKAGGEDVSVQNCWHQWTCCQFSSGVWLAQARV